LGEDKANVSSELEAPIVRSYKSNNKGLVTVNFDQPMIFDDDWVRIVNRSKITNEPRLTVTYKNGYKGTTDFYNNRMTDWEVVTANSTKMEVQLSFSE
jgi:hypothetical protein